MKRPEPAERLRSALVAVAVIAAGANGALAWDRTDRSLGTAVYLAVAAALCLVWAGALIRFPSSGRVLLVGAVDCLAAVAVWILTGPIRLPVGPADPRLRSGPLGSPVIAALEMAMAGTALLLVWHRPILAEEAAEAEPWEISIDGMPLPSWLSVREAAFLAGLDPEAMAASARAVGVEFVAVRGRTRSFPFARTRDLAAAGLIRATILSPASRAGEADRTTGEADSWVARPARRRSRT